MEVKITRFQIMLLKAKLFKVWLKMTIKYWLGDVIKLLWHGEHYNRHQCFNSLEAVRKEIEEAKKEYAEGGVVRDKNYFV